MGLQSRAKTVYWAILERVQELLHIAFYWILTYYKEVQHKVRVVWGAINNIAILASYRITAFALDRELVAISLTEHMGDIMAAQPIAAYVRARHPKATLVWVTRSQFGELVKAFGVIDAIISVQCITEWAWLRGSGVFSRYYDLHINKRSCPICKRTIFRKTGNPLIDMDNYYNYGTLLAIMCQNAGLPILDDGPELTIPEVMVRKIDGINLPKKFIVLHTSSNESSRDWDSDKWVVLVKRLLANTEFSIVEIGLAPTVNLDSPRYLSYCGKCSIVETAEILRRAALFIGIDSGPAHIANAVKTYGVILKGSYRVFANYHSYTGGYGTGETAYIISAKGAASTITVDEVFTASMSMLNKHILRTN